MKIKIDITPPERGKTRLKYKCPLHLQGGLFEKKDVDVVIDIANEYFDGNISHLTKWAVVEMCKGLINKKEE